MKNKTSNKVHFFIQLCCIDIEYIQSSEAVNSSIEPNRHKLCLLISSPKYQIQKFPLELLTILLISASLEKYLKLSVFTMIFQALFRWLNFFVWAAWSAAWGGGCRIRQLHYNKSPMYDAKLHLMVRLFSWSFGKCRVPPQSHYSQVHSDTGW